MLLQFRIANHLSINDEQELSLIASTLKDRESGLIDCPAVPHGYVLPALIIYGANASGKTNIVRAMDWMRQAILYSHNHGDPSGGVPRSPFALDPKTTSLPTTVDVDFVLGGVRYHYGFKATNDEFTSEWLYAFPRGKRQTWFERENARKIFFGRELKGRNKVISDLMRPNSLYLSTATQNDHAELSPISAFFEAIELIRFRASTVLSELMDGEIDERTISFLNRVGTGVSGYRRKKIDESEKLRAFEKELSLVISKFLGEKSASHMDVKHKNTVLELKHIGPGGLKSYFDFSQESAGTRRLILLLSEIYRALDQGIPVIIDELDASLHTQACEALVSLFCDRSTNASGAQLISTTHDTNLMRSPLLRRDQIWFTEKDGAGATQLFPLTDIRTRKDDNIEHGYLQGRYGATPLPGLIADLLSEGGTHGGKARKKDSNPKAETRKETT